MDLHTLNKSLAITDKEICLYEPNAFASHLMLDSEEVYQMTKRKMNAAQIATAKRIHINLVLVKLLELHHLGYDLRHYHAQHHAFIQQKKAGPSAWICTTSYLPNALQSAAKKEELTAASPPDVKIGTKKFSKKQKNKPHKAFLTIL